MAPDEANPYDSRGELYAFNGRLDEAIESFRKACEIKPGFSTDHLGEAYLLKRDYARAESCFKYMASADDKWVRSTGRLGLAYVPLYQGKFDEALRLLADGIGADRMEQTLRMGAAGKYRLMALIHIEKGDFEAAVEAASMNRELRLNASPEDSSFAVDFLAGILLEAGNLAEAERLTEPIRARHESGRGVATVSDWLVLGLVEYGRGNIDEAIELLRTALEAEDQPYFHLRTHLAEAFIEAGRLGEAVELLEAALSDYGRARAMVPIRAVKAYYWLGLAYEGSGWTAKAIEQYETFLGIWKDADPGIATADDARQRLARLRTTL
jgi:tetratricopeptide (TPR) repeat protein